MIKFKIRTATHSVAGVIVEILASPFPGQGIANDLKTGGLIGIDRKKQEIIFAEIRN